MNRKQLIAVGALPLLAVTMTGIYHLLARLLGAKRAWHAGFLVYWTVWCIYFPVKLLGSRRFRAMFSCRKPKNLGWLIMLLPPLLAFLDGRLHERQSRRTGEKITRTFMAIVNGTLEEVLWRGVYMLLFPGRPLWSIIWPSIWFALWHYGPGSILPSTNVWLLVSSAAALGVALGWLTAQTKSVCGAVFSHGLAGVVQGLS